MKLSEIERNIFKELKSNPISKEMERDIEANHKRG